MTIDLKINATAFVVVLEDRHTDPQISVHATRAGADDRVAKHKATYGAEYEWSRNLGVRPPWVHSEMTDHDDGPNVRIEQHEVES